MVASFYVSDEPNESDLFSLLKPDAIRCPLVYGDVVFYGVWEFDYIFRGPHKVVEGISICVERKRIRDMMNSIQTGRYMHQVQSAKGAGFDRLILIVEGEVQPDPKTGLLQTKHSASLLPTKVPAKIGNAKVVSSISPRAARVPKSWSHQLAKWYTPEPTMAYSRWDEYLSEIDILMGIPVKRSQNVKETAAIVRSLWSLFQKPPSQHSSLEVFYRQPPPRVDLYQQPGFLRRVVKEIDGIGWDRSREVEALYRSVHTLCHATVKDWMKIPGIGKVTATRAVQQLNGGEINE